MYSIRGAITVERDTKEEVFTATTELFEKIVEENNLNIKDVFTIIFTATKDIKSAYPAEALRNIGLKHISYMCMQEMDVENSLNKCIRILVLVNGDKRQSEVKNVYLREAINLRPELNEGI
ncbi:chorismate mutase [Caloramator australicus]|uniref:chorismate mutase n=1 Tax=Caloramator australicus RC3 TaxID=857293 RepID=I7LIZ0_9CLOT|nr:chorismate mutase [Caloramator australicus]CCJ33322.1 Chorismate mutase II [Caloramator australicus RC3]